MSSFSYPRLVGLAMSFALVSASSGCAAEGDAIETDVVDEDAEALTRKAVCTKSNYFSEGCGLLRYALAVNSGGGERGEILRRGFRWVEQGVMYSKTRNHTDENGSYRRDCSGFVSMAWGLGASPTTRNFAPFSGDFSYDLPDYASLLPGDALNRRKPRNGNYHIVLFGGWSEDKTEFFLMQELATGSPAMISKHYWTELGEYAPLRKHGL